MEMWKYTLYHIVLNRLLIVVIGLFALFLSVHINPKAKSGDSFLFPIYQGGYTYTYIQPLSPLIHMWSVWDTKWYVSIAEDGYSKQQYPYTRIDNKGFLPVYPFLLALISHLLFSGNTHITGIVISNIFLALALFFLVRLIQGEKKIESTSNVKDAVLYTILFPTSYYLSAIYPESLFLLLSILVFYFVQKEKLYSACIVFSIACLTKTFGIFLLIPILIYCISHRQELTIYRIISYGLIASILPVIYLIYMQYLVGDAFAYIHIQEMFFRHSWKEPFSFLFGQLFTLNPYQLWSGSFLLFGLGTLLCAYKKIPLSYTLYALCYILFTPTTGVLEGSSRYLASLFVIPIALSVIVQDSEKKHMLYMLFSIIQGFAILWWVAGTGFAS